MTSSACTSLSVFAKELCEALEMKPPALKELITAFSREQKEKEPGVLDAEIDLFAVGSC